MLLHGFEERGLRFWRRAVDFIGENHVSEERPFRNMKSSAGFRVVLQDVGAGDVPRHQVGRELDPLEGEVQNADTVHTSNVFAKPGTPRSRQWPRLNMAISSCSTTSDCPTMTLPICSRISL